MGTDLLVKESRNKKGRRTKTTLSTPAKGRTEQYLADAPCGAWASGTAFIDQEPMWLRLAVSSEAVTNAYALCCVIKTVVSDR